MAVIAASTGCRKVLFALLTVLAPPAAACTPPDAPAKVRFVVSVAEPVLRNDRPRAAIAAIAGAGGLRGHSQAGLTQSETQLHVEPSVRWSGVKGGSGCVTLTSVEAAWRQPSITVDIAAQYRPGTCEYAVILEHEREHVRLTRRAFDAQAPLLEAKLRELAAAMAPFETSATPDQAAVLVNRRLMAGLRPLTEAFNEASRRANATIDTRENYQALTAKCRNW